MSQAFPDEIYGAGRGPSFQTRGGNQRGATQDPFGGAAMPAQSPMQSPVQSQMHAPPGGRELPSGYVIPPAPQAKPQSVPQSAPVNPSAGAREAANEQAAAGMAAQADAAHKEAMAALKAAGQAKAAQQTAQQTAQSHAAPPSAAHAAAAAAAQVAAHAAPRQGPPPPPQVFPRVVPPLDPNKGPSVAPAAQVAGVPLDQFYAQYCNPLDPFDPNCAVKQPVGSYPPSGIYNPQAANPSVSGNLSARTITGSVGVGQITGQVPAGTPSGVVGGIYSGVSQPGVYGPTFGAGQAMGMQRSSGVAPEEAWLIACKTTADGWLNMQPVQKINRLAAAGASKEAIHKIFMAVDAFACRKTGRCRSMQPMGMQVSGNQQMGIQPVGMNRMTPAGQVSVSVPFPDYTLPAVMISGVAAIGLYFYFTSQYRKDIALAKASGKKEAKTEAKKESAAYAKTEVVRNPSSRRRGRRHASYRFMGL